MNYRREIDGLRALAVIPVILFHAGFGAFSGGFVGVDLFFVISGYLITSIILAEYETGKFSLIHFYERRARRILPALFLVLAVSIPLAWLWLLPQDMKNFARSVAAVYVFSSNILFWHESGYFDTAAELKPLLHTWSLAVEEQYYLVFPLFLTLTWRMGKRYVIGSLIIIAITSLIAAQRGAYSHPTATFFLLPTRAWELAMGALVACLFAQRQISTSPHLNQLLSGIGLILIIYAVFAFNRNTPFPSLYALVPTIGATLIISFATPATLVGRILGGKLLVGIGLISYSVYLWHQPLFAFARQRNLTEPSSTLLWLLIGASVLLAYLSWRYVEKPFRRNEMISRAKLTTFSVLAGLPFLVFGVCGELSDGYRVRMNAAENQLSHLFLNHINLRDDGRCNLDNDNYRLARCIKGDPRSRATIAVIGDSHAASLAFDLDKLGKKQGFSFIQYTKNTCPLSLHLEMKPSNNCARFMSVTFDDIDKQDIKTVIVATRWQLYTERTEFDSGEGAPVYLGEWLFEDTSVGYFENISENRKNILQAYRDALEKLVSSGRKIIVVYPIPEVGWRVPEQLIKLDRLHEKLTITTALKAYKSRNKYVIEMLDELPNTPRLIRVKPEDIFCRAATGRCVAAQDGEAFYYDNNHLSNTGAAMLLAGLSGTLTN